MTLREGLDRCKHVIAFGILLILLSAVWLVYRNYVYVDVSDRDVVIVKAPKTVKSLPLEPGGLVVPHKDKEIYGQISNRSGAIFRKASEESADPQEIHQYVRGQLQRKQRVRKIPVSARLMRIEAQNSLRQEWDVLLRTYGALLSGFAPMAVNDQQKCYLHVVPVRASADLASLCDKLSQLGAKCTLVHQ